MAHFPQASVHAGTTPLWSPGMDHIPQALLLAHKDGVVRGYTNEWARLTGNTVSIDRYGWTAGMKLSHGLGEGTHELTLISGQRFGYTFPCVIRQAYESEDWFWISLREHSEGNQQPVASKYLTNEEGRFANSIRQLIENFPNGTVSILDTDYRMTFIEGQSLRKHGIEPSDIVGKLLKDLISQEECDYVFPFYERAMKGETVEFEFTYKGKFHYLFSCMPLYNHKAEITGITILNREISYLKSQEKKIWDLSEQLQNRVQSKTRELTQSKERFSILAEAVPAVIWTTSADGTRMFFNQEWYAYTGLVWSPGAEIPWMEAIHPDDQQAFVLALEEARLNRTSREWEYRLRRADGEYRWFWGKATPQFDASQTFIGLIGAEMDIQTIKDIESKLLSTTRALDNSHSELVELSYILYQEIEQELEALNKSLTVLKDSLETEDDPDDASVLIVKQAEQRSEKILDLIEHSHHFTRLSYTVLSPQSQRLDLLVRQMLTSIMINDCPGEPFDCQISDSLEVHTDPHLLETMLKAILQNCVDFRKPGEQVKVELSKLERRNRKVYAIRDHGIGIHPGEASLLFDMFFTGRNIHRHERHGLGLTIAKRCALKLGGDVWAEAAAGGGTVIYLQLD